MVTSLVASGKAFGVGARRHLHRRLSVGAPCACNTRRPTVNDSSDRDAEGSAAPRRDARPSTLLRSRVRAFA